MHIVARYTRKSVDLKCILTPIRIRQSRGASLLMAGLLHALKGQGLPLYYYNLLPLLETHTRSRVCCEIYHEHNKASIHLPVAHIYHDTDRLLLYANNHGDGPTPGVSAQHLTTERDFITEFRQQWAKQHRAYSGTAKTLFHHIQAVADTNSVLTYENDEPMISTLQHLHMSDLLHHDDDELDANGPNEH